MDSAATKAATRATNTNVLGNNSDQVSKLIDMIDRNSLSQIVDLPTRIDNILDLVLVNNLDLVDNIELIENVSVTDHKMIIAHLNTEAVDIKEEV